MNPYPILFHPILKEKVWGGRSLEALGKNLPPGKAVGESWELADLPKSIPGGRSVIANGEFAGQTLRQTIDTHKQEVMGDAKLALDGGFPLLIKYLDARQNLSVQVHPSPEYAAQHPEAHLKSEAWVVTQADPDAVIYKGVKPGVTAQRFADDIRGNDVVKDLVAVPAKPGDCHYLPSGTCHALGAGIVVAEIQTPSDTTFRVYDWGRDASAAGRELHIEQALQCIHFGRNEPQSLPTPHKPIQLDGIKTTYLCASEFFQIERVDALKKAKFPIVTSALPEVWMLIAGSGKIETDTGEIADLCPGSTALIPAAMRQSWATLQQHSWLLRVKLPSPLRGMIA